MSKITIDIPEDMDAAQRADLTTWIQHQVELAHPKRLVCEDDPAWQTEAVRRIKAGMQDVRAGRLMTSGQARRRLDEKLGLSRPA